MSDVLAGAVWGAVTAVLFFGCRNLAAVVLPREDFYQKTLHTVVLCWAVIVAAAVVLGAVNQLTPLPLLSAVLLAAFGLFAVTRFLARAPVARPRSESTAGAGQGPEAGPSQGETAKSVEAALWLFLLSLGACHLVRNGLLRFPDDFDSLMYHLPLIDHWLQARGLYAPDAWQWSTPGNNELIGLWCVAPFSGDFLYALMNVPAVLVLALASRELASLLGLGGLRASVVAAAVTANYVVLNQLVDAENDVAVAALTLAAAAYALRFARSGRQADLVLCGVGMGLLAGVKFYALGYAAAVWVALAAAAALCSGPRTAARAGLVAAALAVCWGGYWYARNTLLTGSPLYPKGLFGAADELARYYPEAGRSSFVGNGSPELLSLAVEAVWKMAGPLHVAALCCLPAAAAWLLASGVALLRASDGRFRGAARLCTAGLAVGAGVVLVCTPFAVEDVPGTLNQMKWAYAPVRYGMTFLSLSVLVFVVSLTDLAGAARQLWVRKRPFLVPTEAPGRPGRRRGLLPWCVGAAPVLTVLALAAHQLTTGLPKFKEDTAELLLFAADGTLLAVLVRWAGAWVLGRRRVAALVVGGAVLACAAAGPLSGRWHAGFAAFYDRMFEPGLFTALAAPSRRPECICVLDFRPYPFFGSGRQHRVCQPHRPRDAAAFYDYLLGRRVTLVAARFDADLRPRGWELCRLYVAENAELLAPAKEPFWPYALYRVRPPAEGIGGHEVVTRSQPQGGRPYNESTTGSVPAPVIPSTREARIMLATLTTALLLAAPPATPAAPAADAPPAKAELFADEAWYKNQKAPERDFVGVLSKAAEPAAGLGRFNLYRLTMNHDGKQTVREVYAGAHPELLAPYVGQKVKLLGKAVDTEVEGKVYAEVWPARLEVVEAPAAPGLPPEAPPALDLLRANRVYIADPTPEKDYVGVLQKMKGENAVGYRLLVETGDHIDRQDLHLFDNNYDRLKPYDGLRVKVVGKKLTGIVQGQPTDYILPGKLEVEPAAGEKPAAKEWKVLARADWTAGKAVAPLALVIRNPEQLALAYGEPPDRATLDAVQEQDATLVNRMFKVEKIDWKTQMIVVASAGAEPTGGYGVEITGLVAADDVLRVHWRLNVPKPGEFVTQTFTHPAQAVLTERFDGKVLFDAPPKAAGKGVEK